MAQFHRVQTVVISGINTKSAFSVKLNVNHVQTIICHVRLWQNSVFLIDYVAGLGHILPLHRKTNLWKFIHYLSAHFHNC